MSENVDDQKLVLTKRETAKLLGIGRGAGLDDLIRRGVLKPIVIGGRVRVPRSQIDALALRGEEPRP